MKVRSNLSKITLGAAMLAGTAQPTLANVKAGVEAWSRGEFAIAVEQWRKSALRGDADAQFNIGQAYKMGRGVKADLDVALDWYRQAADQGHLQAADNYGHLLHHQGKIAEAIIYLQASAQRGDPRSQYLLGTELFNGVHIEKDWVRAYALMTSASAAGIAPAMRSLTQMDKHISPEQRRQAAEVDAPPASANASPSEMKEIMGAQSVPAAVKSDPARSAKSNGNWRIQLGAFGSEEKARKLWSTMDTEIAALAGLNPYYIAKGKLTRLQAGPFATRSAADTACRKLKAVGQTCIAVDR